MSAATIRPMAEADIPAAIALWRLIPGMSLRRLDDSPEGILRYLKRNPTTSFVAEIDKQLVGTVLCGHDGRRGIVHHTCVLSEHRGKGIAAALMEKALAALKAEGIHRALLLCFADNALGNRFWQSQGWERRDDLCIYFLPLSGENNEENS